MASCRLQAFITTAGKWQLTAQETGSIFLARVGGGEGIHTNLCEFSRYVLSVFKKEVLLQRLVFYLI